MYHKTKSCFIIFIFSNGRGGGVKKVLCPVRKLSELRHWSFVKLCVRYFAMRLSRCVVRKFYTILLFSSFGISNIWMSNRRGLSTDPWNTPGKELE